MRSITIIDWNGTKHTFFKLSEEQLDLLEAMCEECNLESEVQTGE